MKNTIITGVIAAVVFGGGGYFFGTQQAASTQQQGGAQQFAGGNGTFVGRGAGGARTGAFGGGATMGTIVSSDANSITIQLASFGTSTSQTTQTGTKLILVGNSTQIEKTVYGTAADITAGKTVTVIGTAKSDGSITATAVQIRPARTSNSAAPTSQ